MSADIAVITTNDRESRSGDDDIAITPVEFWFDPICPWTWLTSRWLLEVADHRPLDIRWRVMSLSLLNDGREMPQKYVELLHRAWGPVRVLTAAQSRYGDGVVLPLFDEFGERYHRHSRDDDDAIIAESLAAIGLPADVADAAHDNHWDDLLRESHLAAMALVGEDVGSPVIMLPDAPGSGAFFGPVVNPVPRGDDALRIWDGVVALAGTSQFHELKRSRDGEPIID